MRLLVCLHYKFIPVDNSDSLLWICMSRCLPRLMIFRHSNVFNPPTPPDTIPLYFIWPLNTQTPTHTHTRTHAYLCIDPAHSLCARCMLTITISLAGLRSPLPPPHALPTLPPLPGANQRQPRDLWTPGGPLRWIADRQRRKKSFKTEGARETAGEGTLNLVCTIAPIGVHMYCAGRREVFSV